MLLFLCDVQPDPTFMEQVRENNYVFWILGGVSLAGLGVLGWFIYRRMQREKEQEKKDRLK